MSQQRLKPAAGSSCGPVAVGAVTGAPEAAVRAAILEAAAEDKQFPKHLNDTNFRHQARAVEKLGFDLFDLQGNKIAASAIAETITITTGQYGVLQKLEEFVQGNRQSDVLLCNAFTADNSHTFALDGQHYFDNNTGGQIVGLNGIPKALRDFRMIRAVALRERV